MTKAEIIAQLRQYFEGRPEVAFVFLFGSRASGDERPSSDVDVAVYFFPKQRRPVEFEEDVHYPTETEIWEDLEDLLHREVDLVVLNRVPATVAVEALRGVPVLIRDEGLYLDFDRAVFFQALDFTEWYLSDFLGDKTWWKSRLRRLAHLLEFLEAEIADWATFREFTWQRHLSHRADRRNVERWVENLVLGSVDAAKMVLKLEGIHLPQSYREIVSSLAAVEGFEADTVSELACWTRLKNIITYEYLNGEWDQIKAFIQQAEPYFRRFLKALRKYVQGKSNSMPKLISTTIEGSRGSRGPGHPGTYGPNDHSDLPADLGPRGEADPEGSGADINGGGRGVRLS